MSKLTTRLAPLAASVLLAACASQPARDQARTATLQRTAYGVAHITAPDPETLAYGVAYARAQDNGRLS
jgi:acyl-homoserine-lactone acylase